MAQKPVFDSKDRNRCLGVFWTEPVADIVSSTACYLTMYFTVYRKLEFIKK